MKKIVENRRLGDFTVYGENDEADDYRVRGRKAPEIILLCGSGIIRQTEDCPSLYEMVEAFNHSTAKNTGIIND